MQDRTTTYTTTHVSILWLRRSVVVIVVIAAAVVLVLVEFQTSTVHVLKQTLVPKRIAGYLAAATKVPPAPTLSKQALRSKRIATRKDYVNKPVVTKAPPTVNSQAASNSTKPVSCSDLPLTLAEKVVINENFKPNLDKMRNESTLLQEGGCYKPPNCTSSSKIAILIPFRDREQHLQLFLYYMHPMLQRQQTEYCIYVIEQVGTDLFNRGMLFNVGVKEAMKDKEYDCFALHDVDLIAENQRNSYHCPEKARHLSALIHRYKHSWRPYYSNFGGAAIVRRDHFEKIDGFSNLFWGWGGEDDEISGRLSKYHIPRERVNETLGVYTMLMNHHTRAPGNSNAMSLLRSGPSRYGHDGLNTTRYDVIEKIRDKLYTRSKVKLFHAEPDS